MTENGHHHRRLFASWHSESNEPLGRTKSRQTRKREKRLLRGKTALALSFLWVMLFGLAPGDHFLLRPPGSRASSPSEGPSHIEPAWCGEALWWRL